MVTRLAVYGGPGRPYGAFAGKGDGAGKGSDPVTRLVAYGGPGRLYGSFAGKGSSGPAGKPSTRIARLDLYGGPSRLYGSFAGKVQPPVVTDDGRLRQIDYRNDDGDIMDLMQLLLMSGVLNG